MQEYWSVLSSLKTQNNSSFKCMGYMGGGGEGGVLNFDLGISICAKGQKLRELEGTDISRILGLGELNLYINKM